MKAAKFIAISRASKEAQNSANLLKSLNINALITGERGVGKLTLACYIMDAPIVDGSSFNELVRAAKSNSGLIIKNFQNITNYAALKNIVKKYNTRLIATASANIPENVADDFFSIKINLPPLSEREEDVRAIGEKFLYDIMAILGESDKKAFDISKIDLDISENCYSLRRSIYFAYLTQELSSEQIMNILENYLIKKIGGNDDYRQLLYLFDVPMIRAGIKKFKSQLKIAERFGLNRNTLRKKINELEEFLK